MTKRIVPTPEELRELLRYEPDTGNLYWKPRDRELFTCDRVWKSTNSMICGRKAGEPNGHGYLRVTVLGYRTVAHRVAWAIYYGEWPDDELDHINMVRDDNRICNLRQARRFQNSHNKRPPSNNITGVKGVSWHKHGRKWQAYINCGEGRRYLGLFESFDAAVQARRLAAEAMQEFAREN